MYRSEQEARNALFEVGRRWLGCNEKDGSHMKIINVYNKKKPLPRGYKVQRRDSWCATFVSAVAIAAGMDDIIPRECSCPKMIGLFQKMGRWQENDGYTPERGDIIFYDWQDSGKGDNRGSSDHVGIVYGVSNNTITVLEGNKRDRVEYRFIAKNGRFIRGFGLPDYSKKCLHAGDIVMFSGVKHYTSNTTSGKAKPCKPGKAKVTYTVKGAHPVHLITVPGSESTVYGYVDLKDVTKIKE